MILNPIGIEEMFLDFTSFASQIDPFILHHLISKKQVRSVKHNSNQNKLKMEEEPIEYWGVVLRCLSNGSLVIEEKSCLCCSSSSNILKPSNLIKIRDGQQYFIETQ